MSRTAIKGDIPVHDNHLLLVGGGPRSVIQVNTEIAFMLLYQSHFQTLMQMGARYRIKTTIVEKARRVGTGASFSASQTGMANSGIEDDISFPLPLECVREEVEYMLSYKKRYERRFGQHPEQYYNELRKVNLPGAVMFRRSVGPISSTPSGQLDHSGAYLMRRTVGEEEYEHFTNVRRMAQRKLPFYKLEVQHSRLLESISAGDETKPMAQVRNLEQGVSHWVKADQIRLNTGTTLKNPISNPAVRQLTFCRSMNAVDMKRFFSQREMLGLEGKVLPGIKILCGGLNLSALDQISALDGIMGLFEEDDGELLGYRVTERAKRLYQGAITLVSRTPGKTCIPRHSSGPEWQQETPVLGSTKHLHSLFLHQNGEQVFELWIELLKAAVARASNRTPRELDSYLSTVDLVYSQFEETRWFLHCRRKAGVAEMQGNMAAKEQLLKQSSQTLEGAWRQAALSLILGFGLEVDLQNAMAEMEKLAPITYKGRQSLLMHRAQINSITHPRTAFKACNKGLVNNMRKIMSYVTASPVEVHSMFALLLEAGIANFVTSSYSDISCDRSGRYLYLAGKYYDALVVSPMFERNVNPAVTSLSGQVRPIHKSQPSYGEVGKFRQFLSMDGNPIPVEDNGLGGAGFELKEGDGKGSLIGAFAVDINNRASAASTAASFAMRRMALSHLKAAGIKSPMSVLDRIYEEQKPDEGSFRSEVENFKKYFEEVYEIRAYLKAIQNVCGKDSEMFRKLYDTGSSSEARKAEILNMYSSDIRIERDSARQYTADVMKRPRFNPPGRDDYLSRFVDRTKEEDVLAYQEALKVAERHLAGRWHKKANADS